MVTKTTGHRPAWIGFFAVVVTALVLRPAATAVGPVLTELSADLGMSSTVAGLLTALPGFVFALLGLTANRLVAYMRPVTALVLASALIAFGSALRALTGSWALFLLLSLIALGGMAIGNVLVPAFIKSGYPRRSAVMATVYTVALAIGATVPNLLVGPLVRFGGWRFSVGVWSAVAVVAMLAWMVVARSWQLAPPSRVTMRHLGLRAMFHSPMAIALMFFFGLQSMQAYIQFGWLAEVYRSAGLSVAEAAIMLAVISAGGIPGGILMPRLVARGRGLRLAIVCFSILLVVGYGGLATFPTSVPWFWALCLSIAGFCFPTALALIIEKTEDPAVTSAVSGFVQPVGYLLAATGPLLIGVVFGWIGAWPPILWGLAACALPMGVAGWIAASERVIDEDLSTGGP